MLGLGEQLEFVLAHGAGCICFACALDSPWSADTPFLWNKALLAGPGSFSSSTTSGSLGHPPATLKAAVIRLVQKRPRPLPG